MAKKTAAEVPLEDKLAADRRKFWAIGVPLLVAATIAVMVAFGRCRAPDIPPPLTAPETTATAETAPPDGEPTAPAPTTAEPETAETAGSEDAGPEPGEPAPTSQPAEPDAEGDGEGAPETTLAAPEPPPGDQAPTSEPADTAPETTLAAEVVTTTLPAQVVVPADPPPDDPPPVDHDPRPDYGDNPGFSWHPSMLDRSPSYTWQWGGDQGEWIGSACVWAMTLRRGENFRINYSDGNHEVNVVIDWTSPASDRVLTAPDGGLLMSLRTRRHSTYIHDPGESENSPYSAYWAPGVFNAEIADIRLFVDDSNCR